MAMLALRSMTGALCALLLWWGGATPVSSDVRQVYVTDTHMDDVTFTTHILSPFRQVRSLLECVQRCVWNDLCKTLTYLSATGSGSSTCQGHSEWMNSSDTHMGLPHAKTFRLRPPSIPDWRNTSCVSASDCVALVPVYRIYPTESLPVCYKQRCLCTIGYFFSLRQRLCVKACPVSQLASSFSMYPGSGVNGYNHYTFNGSVEQCQQQCVARADCQNMETKNTNYCYASRVSGVNLSMDDAPWNYYHRDCA